MIVRVYTGPDNESHFEELATIPEGETSLTQRVSEITFIRFPADGFYDWHPAPRRQYVITLEGGVEVGLGDGTKRQFSPGDILLAEDVTGRGHTTRVIGNQPRLSAMIPIA